MIEKAAPSSKILIVDDEPDVCSVLVRFLSSLQYECLTSPNAFDALNRIKRDRFALVMSDVRMPGMSGMELLRFIRKHDPDTSVIMITGLAELTTAVDALRMGACDYITKPFDLIEIRRSVRRSLERHRLMVENSFYQSELERLVRDRTLELDRALNDVRKSYNITLEALVSALDAREHETKAHSQRVREYATALACELGLGEEALARMKQGALLHDVGKIGVPDSILMKPGKLTPEEWVEMRKHPSIGFEILQGIQFLAPAAEIVLTHQERWDGTGYPGKLSGLDIPLGARIFAVVDTLDAMTSDRPYRKALSFSAAMEEIRRCRGTQFDPEIVDAFLDIEPDRWLKIRDKVNLSHQDEKFCEVLCRS